MSLCRWLKPDPVCKGCVCSILADARPGFYRILQKGEDDFLELNGAEYFWFAGFVEDCCALFYFWTRSGWQTIVLDCNCICGLQAYSRY